MLHHKHTNFEWLLMVGDVANMYDELDHTTVDKSIDRLLTNSPAWLHRRARVNMGFSVTPWGKVTEGRSTVENKEVFFDIRTINEICRLDNEYC